MKLLVLAWERQGVGRKEITEMLKYFSASLEKSIAHFMRLRKFAMGKKYYMKDGEKVYLKEEEIKDEDEDKEEGEEKKDGEEDDEDENIDKAAKRIAKSLASKIPLDQIKDLSDQVKKLTDR